MILFINDNNNIYMYAKTCVRFSLTYLLTYSKKRPSVSK